VDVEEAPQAAALALQGPAAAGLMASYSPEALRLGKNGVGEFSILGLDAVIARTGYTGEDGFELFAPAGHLAPFYAALLKRGSKEGLLPCGLGARDALRLEMGYRLYGQDLDEQHSALESGLGWAVRLEKPSFVGKEALAREKEKGSPRRFLGFRLQGKGVPRRGAKIFWGDQPAGEVTSGGYSPTLKTGIAMGYVDNRIWPEGVEGSSALRVYDRLIPAAVCPPPFIKHTAPSKVKAGGG
jgi:aminomethyltransferase